MDRTTITFNSFKTQKTNREIIEAVFHALEEKEYNAIDQLVGYIISGDPSYITSHNNARTMIKSIDRDDLLEELLRYYLDK
ncbi:MAG: IreB family regulatory phosphoprotein [Firmicutes bacterium]|nr:IreB family regulatory phosphoprotein [Bacillota bacterium]